MSEVLSWELSFLLHSFLMGLRIGLAYDALRLLRVWIPFADWVVSVTDAVFVMLAGVRCFLLFYRWNYGVYRGFSLAAIGTGIFLWRTWPGNFILRRVRECKKKLCKKSPKKRLQKKRK